MNIDFKNEFKNLNPEEIKQIINGCAGNDILEEDITKFPTRQYSNKYAIKYIDDSHYGFWVVQYGLKKADSMPISIGTSIFEYQIKITPTRVYFESHHGKSSNPYALPTKRKSLEEYLFLYINKQCPNYKKAILEETQKFLNFLDGKTSSSSNNETTK